MGRGGDEHEMSVQCRLRKGRETGWKQGFFPDSGTDYLLFRFASPADGTDPTPSLHKLHPALGGSSCLSCRGNVCNPQSCPADGLCSSSQWDPTGPVKPVTGYNWSHGPRRWIWLLWACWHQQQYKQDLDQVGIYVCVGWISSWRDIYVYFLLLRVVVGMKTQLPTGQEAYCFEVNSPAPTWTSSLFYTVPVLCSSISGTILGSQSWSCCISQTPGISAVCSANVLRDRKSPTKRTGPQETKRGSQSWLTGQDLLLFCIAFHSF